MNISIGSRHIILNYTYVVIVVKCLDALVKLQ